MESAGEYQLFILWEKACYQQEKILADIKQSFQIVGLYHITWDNAAFLDKLRIFYERNLPDHLWGDKVSPNGFLLIIVKDPDPIYKIRRTTSGTFAVNINMFDCKEMYRTWTGGGGKIHATNTPGEFHHDIQFLLGEQYSEFIDETVNWEVRQLSL